MTSSRVSPVVSLAGAERIVRAVLGFECRRECRHSWLVLGDSAVCMTGGEVGAVMIDGKVEAVAK